MSDDASLVLTSQSLSDANSLPIHRFKLQILHSIENNSVVIVIAPTGSGKTTQIPQFLLEQGWTGIACTQPRRLTAIAMASRVNQEVNNGEQVGQTIGYSVRFDNCTSDRTLCRFITDGMLFREFLQDPLLKKYSVIMIDEAHERTLHTDLLLGLLKRILPKRPDLRIIISSATIEADSFKRFFTLPKIDLITGKRIYGPAIETDKIPSVSVSGGGDVKIEEFIPTNRFEPKIISIEGRTFPVEVGYLSSSENSSFKMIRNDEVIIDGVVRLVQKINSEEASGDILVFLAGRREIEQCSEALLHHRASPSFEKDTTSMEEEEEELMMNLFRKNKKNKTASGESIKTTTTTTTAPTTKLKVLQLYAGMDTSDQMKVFEPAALNERKVILSTNIAEASVTIEGLVFVIDTGRMKVRVYEGAGEEVLLTLPISQASADQRAGRAGRTRPGKAFRLYTHKFYLESMPKHVIPDAQICKLTAVVLQLKAMRICELGEFDFLTALSQKRLNFAYSELSLLGALERRSTSDNRTIRDNHDYSITSFGREMAKLPLEPELAHFFLKACELKCPHEGAALAAMLTIQDKFDSTSVFFLQNSGSDAVRLQRRFWMEEGDHLTLLSVFMSYLKNSGSSVKFCQKYRLNLRNLLAAHRLYSTLLKYTKFNTSNVSLLSPMEIAVVIRKCLISAYPLNVAKSDELTASYTSMATIQNSRPPFNIHPSSVLFKRLPPLILYGRIIESTKKFMSSVSVIEPEWLEEMKPTLYTYKRKQKL